jgi:phosphate transport system permease protein
MTTRDSRSLNSIETGENPKFDLSLPKRYSLDKVFAIATWAATFFGLIILAILLIDVLIDGLPRLDWSFITSFSSRRAASAGILAPLSGSILLLLITALVAFPLGVGAGIYLEEYAVDTWFTRLIEINIANLAAVPSIIYGLLGLFIFVRVLEPITGGRSLLAGALTLALLILPIIIITTREALRTIPDSLRQAGFALGATRWQVIREQIFPIALPGILTGTILALSRAIGETAPLIVIGAVLFTTSLPSLQTAFTALPIQIFEWVSRPQPAFHNNAAAGIIVLMTLLLLMNASAIYLRNKFQQGRR